MRCVVGSSNIGGRRLVFSTGATAQQLCQSEAPTLLSPERSSIESEIRGTPPVSAGSFQRSVIELVSTWTHSIPVTTAGASQEVTTCSGSQNGERPDFVAAATRKRCARPGCRSDTRKRQRVSTPWLSASSGLQSRIATCDHPENLASDAASHLMAGTPRIPDQLPPETSTAFSTKN
jgi:hypothetical protein